MVIVIVNSRGLFMLASREGKGQVVRVEIERGILLYASVRRSEIIAGRKSGHRREARRTLFSF